MRYLIDTSILVKIATERDLLSGDVQAILDDSENMFFISSESIKEFIHLVQTGRIVLKKHFRSLEVFDLIENYLGFYVKFAAKEHLRTFATLEMIEGHSDLSDRLIIAQALTEKMPLISSDTKFPKYRKQGLDLIFNQ